MSSLMAVGGFGGWMCAPVFTGFSLAFNAPVCSFFSCFRVSGYGEIYIFLAQDI